MNVLGFDVGASSGRCILGSFNGSKFSLREIYRFTNTPVHVFNHLYWDILFILKEIEYSIGYSNLSYPNIASLGIDTWGIDFCLFSADGRLVENPYHYLDKRTDGIIMKIASVLNTYAHNHNMGAVHPQSTLCQLVALNSIAPKQLTGAAKLMLIPSALEFLLTGNSYTEYSIASTTCLFDPGSRRWMSDLMQTLEIPAHIFGTLIEAGTVSGPLLPSIASELNIKDLKLITVAGHDTASAVSVIPTINGESLFISCGTCSVIGACVDKPVRGNMPIGGLQLEANSNGSIRYVKNIMGLFFLQQCYLQWKMAEESITFETLQTMAEKSQAFQAFLDFEDTHLLSPGNMPAQIDAFLSKTNQPAMNTKGDYCITILQTLAMYYKQYITIMEPLTAVPFNSLYMIGGGIQNQLLCQYTANATRKDVIAFCPEATAAGNCIAQFKALGEVGGDPEVAELISRSMPIRHYTPRDTEIWDAAYESFLKIQNSNK